MIILYIFLKDFKKYKNRNITDVLSVAALVIIPCFIQVYLLKNHSAVHDFSSLKFSIVLSVVPYVLLPVAAIFFLEDAIKNNSEKSESVFLTTVIIISVFLNCVYVSSYHEEKAKEFFPAPEPIFEQVGTFIRNNTDFYDVVFSNNYVIDESNNCPQSIAFSKKRVYSVTNKQEIYDKVKNLSNEYVINIFSNGKPADGELQEIANEATEVKEDNNMYLYKIEKDDFLALMD